MLLDGFLSELKVDAEVYLNETLCVKTEFAEEGEVAIEVYLRTERRGLRVQFARRA